MNLRPGDGRRPDMPPLMERAELRKHLSALFEDISTGEQRESLTINILDAAYNLQELPLIDTSVRCGCFYEEMFPVVREFDFWPSSVYSVPAELVSLMVEYACPLETGRGCASCLKSLGLWDLSRMAEYIRIPFAQTNIPFINNACTAWALTYLRDAIVDEETRFTNAYI